GGSGAGRRFAASGDRGLGTALVAGDHRVALAHHVVRLAGTRQALAGLAVALRSARRLRLHGTRGVALVGGGVVQTAAGVGTADYRPALGLSAMLHAEFVVYARHPRLAGPGSRAVDRRAVLAARARGRADHVIDGLAGEAQA